MGRGFSIKSILGKHNTSYVIRPDKVIIESMGWKFEDEVEIFPIPQEGLICIKGNKKTNQEFESAFTRNYLKNNSQTKLKQELSKLNTLIKKYQSIEIALYQQEFYNLLKIKENLASLIKGLNEQRARENQIIDKLIQENKLGKSAIMDGFEIERAKLEHTANTKKKYKDKTKENIKIEITMDKIINNLQKKQIPSQIKFLEEDKKRNLKATEEYYNTKIKILKEKLEREVKRSRTN